MFEERSTILIVDDKELNRAMLTELFRERYNTLECEDGRKALDIYHSKKNEIAVVLLDLIMPVMDGFAFLEELNRTGEAHDIPIVVITADVAEASALKAYDMGAADIIRKPYNAKIIWRRVNNLIELENYRFNLEQSLYSITRELEEQNERMRQANLFIIDALSTAVEFRDSESGLHIRRIREVTRLLLESYGKCNPRYVFTEYELDVISSAAAMHDIGKIAIPDDILKKPGKLTREEFEVMKTHTVRGCDLLERMDYFKDSPYYKYCYDICRYHHERWDGNGYPEGISGNQIPLWSQIVALADVYDALVSTRVYKPPYSHTQAISMVMEGRCGAFNPELLKCFGAQQKKLKELYDTHLDTPYPITRDEDIKPVRKMSNNDMDPSERVVRLMEVERAKYRILEDNSGEIVFDYDVRQDILSLSEKSLEIFDCPLQIVNLIKVWQDTSVIHDEDKELLAEIRYEVEKKKPLIRKRLRMRTKKGVFEWFEILLCGLWDMEDGNVCMDIVGKIVNIDEWKRDAEIWRHQASHDSLTNVYNRSTFEDLVTKILEQYPEKSEILMFLDIDNFKTINDSYGRQFGDRVLQYVANILVKCFRSSDIIGRYGGDEFAIFLRDISEMEFLEKKLLLLYSQLSIGYQENTVTCPLTFSIGIARIPKDGKDFPSLLGNADKALYEAKANGKGCFKFYHETMEGRKYQSRVLPE